MAKNSKSPVSTVVIVALALLIFVAAVGIGVTVLGKGEPADASTVAPTPEPTVEPTPEPSPSEEPAPSSSAEPTPAPSAAPGASSSTAPVVSSSAASTAAPAGLTGVFDPAVMNGSGQNQIANYKKINSDVKGWIKIPGTNINYPVLHDPKIIAAPNYHYYLDRDIYKNYSKDGVIYADPYVKFGSSDAMSKNTVLYGHNWTNYSANPRIGNANDRMFAQLTAYHHLNFAKQYPYFYYSTEDEEMAWVVFAAFYTDINFYYNNPNPTDADFSAVIAGAKARSRHVFDVPVTTSDKIITLSTCTRAYGQSDRQRFVVMAKKMSLSDDYVAVKVTANPSPVLPKL